MGPRRMQTDVYLRRRLRSPGNPGALRGWVIWTTNAPLSAIPLMTVDHHGQGAEPSSPPRNPPSRTRSARRPQLRPCTCRLWASEGSANDGRQGDGAAGALGRRHRAPRVGRASLFADDTPVKVLAPGTGKTSTGGPGPMCGTSGPGRATLRRRRGTASRPTARRHIRRCIWWASAAGCTQTAMPGSASSPAPAWSARVPAWRMCGAGLPRTCSGDLRCPCRPGLGDRRRGAGTDRGALRRREGGPRAAARAPCRDPPGQGRAAPRRPGALVANAAAEDLRQDPAAGGLHDRANRRLVEPANAGLLPKIQNGDRSTARALFWTRPCARRGARICWGPGTSRRPLRSASRHPAWWDRHPDPCCSHWSTTILARPSPAARCIVTVRPDDGAAGTPVNWGKGDSEWPMNVSGST